MSEEESPFNRLKAALQASGSNVQGTDGLYARLTEGGLEQLLVDREGLAHFIGRMFKVSSAGSPDGIPIPENSLAAMAANVIGILARGQRGTGHVVSRSRPSALSPEAVLQAMSKATVQAAELEGETKFSVTEEDVRQLFFADDESHGGKVPIRADSEGTLDEEGWLWRKVLGQAAPPMPTTFADRLHRRLETSNDPLLLVVAPSGAGKSFGAWQLGTRQYVDLLDAVRNGKQSLFYAWRRAVKDNELDDALVLKRGETVATVGRLKLNSRKAIFHAWILFCALAAMRARCMGPSDWLFLQRHRPFRVYCGFAIALAVAKKHRLHYEALADLVKLDMLHGPKTVLVVDEASHALPHEHDPTFAPLRTTLPPSVSGYATGSLGRVATRRGGLRSAASRASGSGAGRGAGAGASTAERDGEASRSGLLGCLLQAAMPMKRRMIAMGTSLSFARATKVVHSGSDHLRWARSTHAPPMPYMAVNAFPQLSVGACAAYIKFYADVLGVALDPAVLNDVCNQLQGRPTFVHYFMMHFVRKPSADLKHIWSHGEVPDPAVDPLPDCGAKQLMFSRLCAHYTAVVRAMDADTRSTFLALLRVLAAHYVFGGPSDSVRISPTLTAEHPFDFTEAGLAYLKPNDPTIDGAYSLTEPLAVELCAHLSHELCVAPAAVKAWPLLLRWNLLRPGIVGHTFESVVGEFFLHSQLQLCVWLQQLHKVVSPTSLELPEWCDGSISFTNISRAACDDATGKRLLQLLQGMHGGDTTELPIVLLRAAAGPDFAVVPAPCVLMLITCNVGLGRHRSRASVDDKLESTDANKLYMRNGAVTNATLRTRALAALNAGPVHLVRVSFNLGREVAGRVAVENNEVHVVISTAMLDTAFAGMAEVVRLLRQGYIFPQVQLLGENATDTAANLQLHVRGFGSKLSRRWAAALPRLRTEYDDATRTTRNTVAGVVGIIDSVFGTTRVSKTLFSPDNVAVWKFGDFVFTPEALVAFAAQKKRGIVGSPKEPHQTKHKKARTGR